MNKVSREERNLGVVMHLCPLLGFIIPLLGFIIPIAIWYVKKNDSKFIHERGIEIFNFMITLVIATVIGLVLTWLLVGYLVLCGIAVYIIIISIVAAIQTSHGIDYRYPLILRLIH